MNGSITFPHFAVGEATIRHDVGDATARRAGMPVVPVACGREIVSTLVTRSIDLVHCPDCLIAPGTPYDTKSGLLRPPATARGLSALRALRNGAARQYSAVEWETWNGVEHAVRTYYKLGFIRPSSAQTDGYAVLDVLDPEGDIIADYDVVTAEGFRYIKRKLKLTVVDVEAEVAKLRAGAR